MTPADALSDLPASSEALGRQGLRLGTRWDHEGVDAAFAAYDLGSRDGYGRFLVAQARVFLAVEAALDDAGADRVLEDWPCRRRGEALRQDLADLGLTVPAPIASPRLESRSAILGAIYVLEGSRLGGAMLSRNLPQAAPRRFMAADGQGRWRGLTRLLDVELSTPAATKDAAAAARQVFDRFRQAALLDHPS